MRGKDFNTGLRGVLFEARHYERMGSAVWLYAWLILRQTHQTGETGWVLGGAPVSYREIEEETGFNPRTLERWMGTLRRYGYVQTKAAAGGLIVRITKAKKYVQGRNSARSGRLDDLRKAAAGIRRVAGGVRNLADGDTQDCVRVLPESAGNTQLPPRINSSSVEESIERNACVACTDERATTDSGKKTANPFLSDKNQYQTTHQERGERRRSSDPARLAHVRVVEPRQSWLAIAEARLHEQRLRADRDEAVRRELRVGRGPEIETSSHDAEPKEEKHP